MSDTSGLQAVLFDMGGVLLAMGNPVGMPQGKLDFRGREALAHAIRKAEGRISIEALETVLFEPWRREYARRYELGREADWSPHLKALRRAAHVRSRDLTLLGAWFRPYAETLVPVAGALAAVRALAARGVRLGLVSNVPLPGALYEAALFRSALGELGADPERAAMVGDRRSSDVAGGRAAGVRTVWLESADGGGPKADVEIRTLADLEPALAAL